VPPEQRLNLGYFVADPEVEAVADANKLFQRHAALLGSTGAGKSWTVASILGQAARLPHANIIVLDMHGEYKPLTQSDNGGPPLARAFRIAGPGDLDRRADDVIFLPYWLLTRDEMLSLVLDTSDPDAASQVTRMADHIYKLKRSAVLERDRADIAASFSVDSPLPYGLDDLIAWLEDDDSEKVVQQPSGNVVPGPYHGRLTRFIARIEARWSDPRYGFMFNPPEECLRYEWLDTLVGILLDAGQDGPGIKVIDFSEVPPEALPIVTGLLTRILYDVQFWTDRSERTPLAFVCDEAHLYLPVRENSDALDRQALRVFEEIAKEGRKYGVALMLVTQRPADVSRTIVAQCNNFIVMRLTNDYDQRVVQQLMPESMARLTDVLPLLEVGEAVLLGDALLLPTPVKFHPPPVEPTSATRDFWTDWASQPSSEEAIAAGVDAFRRQVRPGGRLRKEDWAALATLRGGDHVQ
jgi:uncharacterized protein